MKRRELILLIICVLLGYAVLAGCNNKKPAETTINEQTENNKTEETLIATPDTTIKEPLPTETWTIATEVIITEETTECNEDAVETTVCHESKDENNSNDMDTQPTDGEIHDEISDEIFD